jgi:hypothetical protein
VKRDVILRRVFDVKRRGGGFTLTLEVFRPRRVRGGDFGCSYAIRTGRKVLAARGPIYGVDSLQAMLLALGLVEIDVARLVDVAKGMIDKWHMNDLRSLTDSTLHRRAQDARAGVPGVGWPALKRRILVGDRSRSTRRTKRKKNARARVG